MRKKIVMYFHRHKLGRDPFVTYGTKRSVYHYFFKHGLELGLEMYIVSGKENYLGGMKFSNPYFYDGSIFVKKREEILADAVYDRSGGVSFPPKNIDYKVLNCSAFKSLCNDKNLTQKIIGKFMPRSYEVGSQRALKSKLKNFKGKSLAVLKPARGMCGKGIVIDSAEKLSLVPLDEKREYVLQEFVDTSAGIVGITKGRHDLRIIIVGGKIILAHVRTPQKGSFLANVAQGGKIKEVPLDKIPVKVINAANKIKKIIDQKYNTPVFSIDFGIARGKSYVFELNDQIGFPRESMKSAKKFVEQLLFSLEKLTLE